MRRRSFRSTPCLRANLSAQRGGQPPAHQNRRRQQHSKKTWQAWRNLRISLLKSMKIPGESSPRRHFTMEIRHNVSKICQTPQDARVAKPRCARHCGKVPFKKKKIGNYWMFDALLIKWIGGLFFKE